MSIKITKPLVFYFVVFQVSLVLLFFTGGILVQRWMDRERQPLALLHQAHGILEENALVELPSQTQLEYGMIRGMLQAYNEPNTQFVEPQQHELQTNQLDGKFGGIGVRLERDAENYWLMFPFPDSPALKAGVLEGDRLLAVEDLQIEAGTPLDSIEAAIRGPVGERVSMTVARKPDYAPIAVSVRRQEIAAPSVTSNLLPEEPRVGVVRVQVMADSTAKEIESAVAALQERDATHFILDLRGNSGGLVEAGVDSARLFLDGGTVIRQQYKDQPVRSYDVERRGRFADLPLVVLVDSGTASSAEILAGSLQARGRAALIGAPTYGKSTIQLVFELMDHSSLHVTAAKWWVPDREQLANGKGLQPDVLLTQEEAQTAAITRAAVQSLLQ